MQMNIECIIFSVVFIFSLQLRASHGEIFTATDELQKLLATERHIAQLLNNYVSVEENRIAQLKLFRDNYERVHDVAKNDADSYLANPVNAYLLVKRLTIDWQTIRDLMTVKASKSGDEAINNLSQSIDVANSFPSAEDLNGAADALLRLQDTYKLDTSTMARGQLVANVSHMHNRIIEESSIKPRIELTAGDCFELGRHSYTLGDHVHTLLWMREAHERLKKEVIKTADEGEIVEFLAFCTYKEGDVAKALEYTRSLLQLQPNNKRAIGNRDYFESILQSDRPLEESAAQANHSRTVDEADLRTKEYEALCRGEVDLPAVEASRLKCYHLATERIPYMRLMKMKVEEAFKKPEVLMFHEFLHDSEMEKLKQLASTRLTRSTVLNSATGTGEATKFRIAKTAWISDKDDPIIGQITRRTEMVTGLTSESAEDTQVVNYGIGGHYDEHYDFSRENETQPPHNVIHGNRISTWLNYLSDVTAGGATVFPELKIALWPRKGSAAYWRNLHSDGTGDLATRHAACPVLIGSKWIANKWFHERGQEFRRPCSLSPDT